MRPTTDSNAPARQPADSRRGPRSALAAASDGSGARRTRLRRLLLAGGALWLLACGAQPQGPAAGLVVLPGSNQVHTAAPGVEPPDRPWFHSFGEVPWGQVVRHRFQVRNSDPVALRVLDVLSSCGCGVAAPRLLAADGSVERSADPADPDGWLTIPPGRLAEFQLTVDTSALPRANAHKHLMVRVSTDSTTQPWLTLEAHLEIDLGLLPVPAGVDFGRFPQGTGAERTIEISQVGRRSLRPTEVLGAPAGLEVDFEPLPSPARPRWRAVLRAPIGIDLGAVSGQLRLAVVDGEGRPSEPLELPVVGRVVPDIDVSPDRFFLRPRADRERLEQDVRALARVPGLRFRVVGHELSGEAHEHLEFAAEPLEPDASGRSGEWRLTLSAPGDAFTGTVGGELRLLLDDPQHPELRIPYVAFAR